LYNVRAPDFKSQYSYLYIRQSKSTFQNDSSEIERLSMVHYKL